MAPYRTILQYYPCDTPYRAIVFQEVSRFPKSRAAKRGGGFKRGGFPIWTCPSFFLPFCPFLGLSRFFWDFPDLLRDGPGIFPIGPFPLSRPIKSAYEEQSRKGPRHNLDLSRKKWETPRFGTPPGLSSLKQNGVISAPLALGFILLQHVL